MLVEIFKKLLGLFLVGIVIKLLDDEVDKETGIENRYKINLINELGKYKLPYGLILLSIAMVLETYYAFSLFSSAYIIGMFNFINRKLPLKVKAYHEIIIIVIINLVLIPYRIFFHSFIVIILIQALDDILDMKHDLTYGYFNFANKYGKGEMIIVSVILVTSSLMLSLENTSLILLTWFCINYLYSER